MDIYSQGNNLIIKIIGDIDHHSSEELRDKIDKEFFRLRCKNMVFDFNNVKFMDSSGIGMIIGRYKSIEKLGGSLCLCGIKGDLARIFEISGLYRIINVFDSIETALKSLQ
ncbi:MAG: anti-sigma F factor antagonist [Clostridiales bacterium]|nr:anti-sigma F factor antagonist [Clostridiales bacterium]